MQLPFVNRGKRGTIHVYYGANTGSLQSGMDLFANMGFNSEVCVGYPTFEVKISQFEGKGYRQIFAWIQIIRYHIYENIADKEAKVYRELVDNLPSLHERVPYCAYGNLPSFFDAPSNAVIEGERVVFNADTFLVELPGPFNGDAVHYIVGLHWGYEEKNLKERKITILPLTATTEADWQHWKGLLTEKYPDIAFN